MLFNELEKNEFLQLYRILTKTNERIKIFTYENDTFIGQVDTWYETDNGLEEEDELYEEYNACAIYVHKVIGNISKNIQEGQLYEFSYKNIPKKIESENGDILIWRKD